MNPLKITTVVGARPQFVKAAAVSRAIEAFNQQAKDVLVQERIIHTGQHYDESLSQVFFDQLKIPQPWKNLEVGSGRHGQQTGEMVKRLESILDHERPDILLTYGDTNSTLASSLVAAKMQIPIAHVEAGLRSFNRAMPEEINRILTDHVSTWLFCPSQNSANQLASEGIEKGVHVVGDVMYDALLFNLEIARQSSRVIDQLNLRPEEYHLATVHRAENTDQPECLSSVLKGLGGLRLPVILPLHPRTKARLDDWKLPIPENVRLIPPASYLDMLPLILNCQFVFTDSGGLQKEAFWCNKKCITLREETEWTELVECGWNRLVGASADKILAAEIELSQGANLKRPAIYGDGDAAKKIVEILAKNQLGDR